MLTKQWRNKLPYTGAGFIFGAGLMLISGFHPAGNTADDSQVLTGKFGGLSMRIVDLDRSDVKRVLEVSRDGMAFLGLMENASGKVDRFSIFNGERELVALARLTGKGIAEFAVYGNSIGGHKRAPVFMFDASDTPGRWCEVKYVPFTRGETGPYQAVGEVYEDLDFNGQFDAKNVYNSRNLITSSWIFVEGTWQEIFRTTEDQTVTEIGSYDSDEGTAFLIQGEERTDYRFLPGTGWKFDRKTRVGAKERFSELSKVRTKKQIKEAPDQQTR